MFRVQIQCRGARIVESSPPVLRALVYYNAYLIVEWYPSILNTAHMNYQQVLKRVVQCEQSGRGAGSDTCVATTVTRDDSRHRAPIQVPLRDSVTCRAVSLRRGKLSHRMMTCGYSSFISLLCCFFFPQSLIFLLPE